MVKIRKLNCGATFVTDKTDYVQSAALGIWVKTGARDETDDISGVSHFIEHMMFKGTESRTAKQIAEDVDRIGGSFNAFTGKEATCYYIKTLSSNISKGAEILLDMITNSKFDTDEMEKEKQVICEEIKMVADSPDEDVYDTIGELVSSGNPMGRSILGTADTLAGIDREKLYGYYQKNYARDSIVIAMAGNFDEEAMAAIFDSKLMSLNERKPGKDIILNPYKQSFDVKVKDIEQTHICLATPSISLKDDKYYAFTLMNSILGGSMSSRLFQNIREQKGLAYSVASMNAFASDTGFFSIYAGVAHEKVGETLEAIRYELNKLVAEGVTEDELLMAREQIKSSYIFGQESVNSRMFSIGKNQLLINKVYSPEEVLAGFDAVTLEDIGEAAKMIGDFENYCGAAVTGKDVDLEGIIKNGN